MHRRFGRTLLPRSLFCIGLAIAIVGCQRSAESPAVDGGATANGTHQPATEAAVADATATATTNPAADLELRDRIDRILDWTRDHRHLNLRDHAAWQIIHGVLAFQQDFLIEREPGGERISAIDHLMSGGQMKGWSVEPGTLLDEATGRRGFRATVEMGSKTGQGHPDQWLGYLAQCHLPPTQKILLDGHEFTIADWVEQIKLDVPRNAQREYSWTLVALTTYLPTDSEWVASDGKTWTIAQLLQEECEQELASAACGGTHRMGGIAIALNRHLEQGGKLEGAWQQADERVQAMILAAKTGQNPDGSFSSRYFDPGGKSADLARDLSITGHILEFLALGMTDSQIREPWVRRAAAHECGLLEKTKSVAIECGGLYHSARGLALYRERIFGERTPASPARTEKINTAQRP